MVYIDISNIIIIIIVVIVIGMIVEAEAAFSSTNYNVLSIDKRSTIPIQKQQQYDMYNSNYNTKNRLLLYSSTDNNNNNQDEARRLLDRARQVREQLAALQGITIEQVEQEAAEKKMKQQQLQREQQEQQKQEQQSKQQQHRSRTNVIVDVPQTVDEQIIQAKYAIERAYSDGITRQIVRFALIDCQNNNNNNNNHNDIIDSSTTLYDSLEQTWPGGVQQMYRRSVGPMTRELLRILRTNNNNNNNTSTNNNNSFNRQPIIKSQDIWDFDGSALITAQASTGPIDDIHAMVFANTDNKYTKDIATISEQLSTTHQQRLFLLINPFWKDLNSWGYNILAPNAKSFAQQVIFGVGKTSVTDSTIFQETYSIQIRSVRGEDCIAIKSYPYDWQLYVYYEGDDSTYYNNNYPQTIYLGSTKNEPSVSDFGKLLEQRTEFKLNKTMRRIQRRRQ